jgi:hypothetical protein
MDNKARLGIEVLCRPVLSLICIRLGLESRLPRKGARPVREGAVGFPLQKGAGRLPHNARALRLTEVEVSARASNAVQARIRASAFPVAKDFDTFDFTAVPSLNKPKLLELAGGEWIEQRSNT